MVPPLSAGGRVVAEMVPRGGGGVALPPRRQRSPAWSGDSCAVVLGLQLGVGLGVENASVILDTHTVKYSW